MQNMNFIGMSPFVAGWGHLIEYTNMTNILQQVQVPVISNDECKKKFQIIKPFMRDMDIRFNESYVMCAGYTVGGKDACIGDSGGPMMLPIAGENGQFAFYQIGTVSYGLGKFFRLIHNMLHISNFMNLYLFYSKAAHVNIRLGFM